MFSLCWRLRTNWSCTCCVLEFPHPAPTSLVRQCPRALPLGVIVTASALETTGLQPSRGTVDNQLKKCEKTGYPGVTAITAYWARPGLIRASGNTHVMLPSLFRKREVVILHPFPPCILRFLLNPVVLRLCRGRRSVSCAPTRPALV